MPPVPDRRSGPERRRWGSVAGLEVGNLFRQLNQAAFQFLKSVVGSACNKRPELYDFLFQGLDPWVGIGRHPRSDQQQAGEEQAPERGAVEELTECHR